MWSVVINTYSGATTSWGRIIFIKGREDKQLTFNIIKSTCFLVCYISRVRAWAFSNANPGNVSSCISMPLLTPDFKTYIKILALWLCANICQCHLMVTHECSYFDHFKLLQVWMKKSISMACYDCPYEKSEKGKQMMSLTRFSIHGSHFHCSYPSSQVLSSLSFVNGFPEEG